MLTPSLTRYSHRGLTTHHTENTLEALAEALQAGAHWLEIDVNTSKDGVVLVFHDPTLERLTGNPQAISQLTYQQIQEITLPGGEKIPTLEETLTTFPTANFNIDLKDAASAHAIGPLLHKTQAWNRIRLTSFSEDRLALARTSIGQEPHQENLRWGMSEKTITLFYFTAHTLPFTWPLLQKLLAPATVQADAFQIPLTYTLAGRTIKVLTPRFLKTAHRYGYQVHVWTIDDPQQMQELAKQGVDGIITNRVDLLTQLTEFPKRPGTQF